MFPVVFGVFQAIYKSIFNIRKVAESLTPKEILFLSIKTHPCLPKISHSNAPPQIYATVCEDLHNTAQKYILKEWRRNFYYRCSIVAAAVEADIPNVVMSITFPSHARGIWPITTTSRLEFRIEFRN